MKKYGFTLACALILSQAALAQKIDFESVFARGTGCPMESTSIQIYRTEISVSFNSFITTLEPFVPSTRAFSDCKITAKIKVPEGYALVIRGALFKGVYSMKEEAMSTFHSELILDQREHDASSFMMKGDSVSFYHDSSKYVPEMIGNCGGTSVLQFNSSMFIRSKMDERKYVSQSQLHTMAIPYQFVKCQP